MEEESPSDYAALSQRCAPERTLILARVSLLQDVARLKSSLGPARKASAGPVQDKDYSRIWRANTEHRATFASVYILKLEPEGSSPVCLRVCRFILTAGITAQGLTFCNV